MLRPALLLVPLGVRVPIPVPDVSLSSSARLEAWKLTRSCRLLGPGCISSVGMSELC